jgi:peptidoglycan/LPS O-acetylase OafA/YrhL
LLLRETDRTGDISLGDFYARRSLRIYPLYYAVLLLMSAFVFLSGSQSPTSLAFRETLPYLATYLSNWFGMGALLTVSWSLAAEEQFYVVWPILQKVLRRWAIAALLVLIFVNQLVNFVSGPFSLSLPNGAVMLLPAAIDMVCLDHWQRRTNEEVPWKALPASNGLLIGASAALIVAFSGAAPVPFIYFQF